MTIGIDMMGGDFAPAEAARGIEACLKDHEASLVLIGDEGKIQAALAHNDITSSAYRIVHASQHIEMHEHPARALKEKQQSSIALGFQLLAKGEIDAFISAGNTGAMLVGAAYTLKPVEGVLRPTISTIIPKQNGDTGLLLDVGLNADCKPEQLNQFALMGSVYAQEVFGIAEPKVGLLNIGEEEGKGNMLAQATYPLLKENSKINFIGNIEGRDVFSEKADVIVCDGFTGNIILKLAESLHDLAKNQGINSEYFERFDFENVGGTPVLGVSKPIIIGHGISKAKAFRNMIRMATRMVETKVLDSLQKQIVS